MKRSAPAAMRLPDPIRSAVGLPVGTDGEFFVGGEGDFGQGRDDSVVDYNDPPAAQPGLWCPWSPSDDGEELCPPEEETKAYDYIEWLTYLTKKFLTPWGYSLCGVVDWSGEESDDFGQIKIESPTNQVLIARGAKTYGAWRSA